VHAAFESMIYDIMQYRNNVSRIILAADSRDKSWRHFVDYEGDKFAYKGTRKDRKCNFDIEEFHVVFEDFLSIMREKGLYVITIPGVEGDDILYFLSRALLENSQSSMILSSDSDLLQLVKTKEDGSFVYVYDSNKQKKKHFTDVEVMDPTVVEEEPKDGMEFIFNLTVDDVKGGVSSVEKVVSQAYEVISPGRAGMTKILAGDSGDNVPSCMYYVKDKSGKAVSLTELMAGRALDSIGNTTVEDIAELFNDADKRLQFASKLIDFLKPKNIVDRRVVSEGIRRNMAYIFLHKDVYPDYVRSSIMKEISKQLTDRDMYEKHKSFICGGISKAMLEDTKYRFDTSSSNVVNYNEL
jgi:5'-3' exonuclease